jgi:hypothetical protein
LYVLAFFYSEEETWHVAAQSVQLELEFGPQPIFEFHRYAFTRGIRREPVIIANTTTTTTIIIIIDWVL